MSQRKYYPPQFHETQFHCIYCGVYATQMWREFYVTSAVGSTPDPYLEFCVCLHCKQPSYWYKGRMIVPPDAPVPLPHPDMPEGCRADYDEARDIVARSPRAAAALLRLAVQKLMPALGEKGKRIDDDIGSLVKKGLPVQVQQALDYCRVVGNHAVHPGEIELNDTPEVAYRLFDMLNFIVEDRISRPAEIQELYNRLPENARAAVERRDRG